jgi:hypothetical protein
VVEDDSETLVPHFDALKPARFVRIVRVTIENDTRGTPGDLLFPRLEILVRPDHENAAEYLRVRCSGVRDLVIEDVTGGRFCHLTASDIAAWGWEGLRYRIEAEDSLRFYCEDLVADVIAS